MVGVELLEDADDLDGAPHSGRSPEPFRHHPPQQAFGETELTLEVHAFDVVQRDEVVAQVDATGRLQRFDLNVLEAAEAVQVGDRLADFGERERFPLRGLDQRGERGLLRRAALDQYLNACDRPAGIVCGGYLGERGGGD
jgi:hypothetical protein